MPKGLKQEEVRRWFLFTIQDCEDIERLSKEAGLTEAEYVRRAIHVESELNMTLRQVKEMLESANVEIERIKRVAKMKDQVSHEKFGFEVTNDEETLKSILAEEKEKKEE